MRIFVIGSAIAFAVLALAKPVHVLDPAIGTQYTRVTPPAAPMP